MHFTDLWQLLQADLFPVPSTPDLFNPYADRHDELDRPEAPQQRRENLNAYLDAYTEQPTVLLVAEAPGPWGCRFSGVPITSESQLVDPDFPLSGTPTSRADAPHAEYSARIFWRTMQPYWPHFFVWNCVPLHPHRPGEPLSIRTPRQREVMRWAPMLAQIVALLEPDLVLAIGRKAEGSLRRVGVECDYVRHPSQGGAKHFAEGITERLGNP